MFINPFRAIDVLRDAFAGPEPEHSWSAANEALFTQQMAAFVKPAPPHGLGLRAAEWREVAEAWKAAAERSKATIEAAKRAVESLRSREGENVDTWAKELGAILGTYTD